MELSTNSRSSASGAIFTGLPRFGFGASVVSITHELVSAATRAARSAKRRATASSDAPHAHAIASRFCAASVAASANARASSGACRAVATHGDEVGPRAGKRYRLLGGVDVEGDARHLEYLAPPRDQLEPARGGGGAIFDVRRYAEGDVVGAVLGERHGVIARAADVDADDVARAEDVPRLGIAGSDVLAPRQVHAVGTQRARELRVAVDEGGDFLALRQFDQRPGRLQP